MYIYDHKEWPQFQWDQKHISKKLASVRHMQGRLIGGMESIGFQFRDEVILNSLTLDVVKSSEIEGEILDPSIVRSSVARRLGMDIGGLEGKDRHVDGVVEMVLDATQRFNQPLTKERVFGWHAALFPTGWSGLSKINVGSWRQGPVEVVSGEFSKEKVHFEGPAPSRVKNEMHTFLKWIEEDQTWDFVLKSAIAHLWFVTIHPFEDGNGRISRALADLLLTRSDGTPHRFYSLSSQIQRERKSYYSILEKTQKGGMDITQWIDWYLSCLERALNKALGELETVLQKSRYLESLSHLNLNERQRKLLNRLLDGIEGKLTSTKWAKMAKCSQDTAYRDIVDLLNQGLLKKDPSRGRSTSYSLVLPEE